MEQVDDNIPDPWQEAIQTRLARLLRERLFQYTSQQVGDGTQVVGVNADRVEGSTCDVELVAQPHVDVADFGLGGGVAGPLRERFEELFRGHEEVGDRFFDRGELLLRLRRDRLAMNPDQMLQLIVCLRSASICSPMISQSRHCFSVGRHR